MVSKHIGCGQDGAERECSHHRGGQPEDKEESTGDNPASLQVEKGDEGKEIAQQSHREGHQVDWVDIGA